MNKILLSVSGRQETVFRSLAKSLDLPVSEVVRRALDYYIDRCMIRSLVGISADSTFMRIDTTAYFI